MNATWIVDPGRIARKHRNSDNLTTGTAGTVKEEREQLTEEPRTSGLVFGM